MKLTPNKITLSPAHFSRSHGQELLMRTMLSVGDDVSEGDTLFYVTGYSGSRYFMDIRAPMAGTIAELHEGFSEGDEPHGFARFGQANIGEILLKFEA